jgi:hypothetical protein
MEERAGERRCVKFQVTKSLSSILSPLLRRREGEQKIIVQSV